MSGGFAFGGIGGLASNNTGNRTMGMEEKGVAVGGSATGGFGGLALDNNGNSNNANGGNGGVAIHSGIANGGSGGLLLLTIPGIQTMAMEEMGV